MLTTPVHQKKLKELRTTRKGSDEAWEAALAHVLLNEPIKPEHAAFLTGVYVVFQEDGDNIKLLVRQEVATTKLKFNHGEILILRDEDKEIDPLDWARVAARATVAAKDELVELQTRLGTQQGTIDKLHQQLADFVEAKEENDNAMLQKFVELLNEKKLKIRDQQRLLATAKVDPKAASKVVATREESAGTSRKAGSSRVSKRKANRKAPVVESESEDDFEQMQLDEKVPVKEETTPDDDLPEAATPDRSEDETEDEDEAGDAPTSVQPNKPVELATRSSKSKPEQTPAVPPPRRELPFARGNAQGKKPAPPPPVEDDDDETEDDEL